MLPHALYICTAPQFSTMAAMFGKLSQFNDAFLKELEDDFQAPGSSKFQNYMNNCRTGMQKMEEVHV